MNDHDLLIKLGAQLEYLIKEVQQLRDGTKKDISDLQTKVDLLEKADIKTSNDLKSVEVTVLEKATTNGLRITALETANQQGVSRHETNVAYWFRLVIEKAIVPAIIFIGLLILIRTGILNVEKAPINNPADIQKALDEKKIELFQLEQRALELNQEKK